MKNNWISKLPSWVMVLLLTLLVTSTALAQQTMAPGPDQPEMADALRANGKIYVVVLVVFIIVSGLLLYLIRLDRKVGRLEREVEGR